MDNAQDAIWNAVYMPDMLKDTEHDEKRIACDKAYPVVMSNNMIKGRQPMNIREQKIFRLLLSQVQPDTERFQVFQIPLHLLANILGIQSVSSLRRDISKIVTNLQTQFLAIRYFDEDDKEQVNENWRYVNIMALSEFDGQFLRLQLSDKLAPYVLNLQGDYTKYPITTVAGFTSGYALRIYEILLMTWNKCRRTYNSFVVDVQMLKSVLKDPNPAETKDTYTRYFNFKARVLLPAVKQINDNLLSEFTVEFSEIKPNNKTVTELRFCVTPREYYNELCKATPEELKALKEAYAINKQLSENNVGILKEIKSGTTYMVAGDIVSEGVSFEAHEKPKSKNVITVDTQSGGASTTKNHTKITKKAGTSTSIEEFVDTELSTKDQAETDEMLEELSEDSFDTETGTIQLSLL